MDFNKLFEPTVIKYYVEITKHKKICFRMRNVNAVKTVSLSFTLYLSLV